MATVVVADWGDLFRRDQTASFPVGAMLGNLDLRCRECGGVRGGHRDKLESLRCLHSNGVRTDAHLPCLRFGLDVVRRNDGPREERDAFSLLIGRGRWLL